MNGHGQYNPPQQPNQYNSSQANQYNSSQANQYNPLPQTNQYNTSPANQYNQPNIQYTPTYPQQYNDQQFRPGYFQFQSMTPEQAMIMAQQQQQVYMQLQLQQQQQQQQQQLQQQLQQQQLQQQLQQQQFEQVQQQKLEQQQLEQQEQLEQQKLEQQKQLERQKQLEQQQLEQQQQRQQLEQQERQQLEHKQLKQQQFQDAQPLISDTPNTVLPSKQPAAFTQNEMMTSYSTENGTMGTGHNTKNKLKKEPALDQKENITENGIFRDGTKANYQDSSKTNGTIQRHNPLPKLEHSDLHLTIFPLVSEYLNVAYSISWSIVTGRQTIELYRMLISCSIACLYSVLKEPNLHPFVEIQTRLKLAAILSEESTNWEAADQIVTKGIALAKTHNYWELAMHLKYAAIRALANTTMPGLCESFDASAAKSLLNAIDSAITESKIVAEESQNACPYFRFVFEKITVLFSAGVAHGTMGYVNDAFAQLEELQQFKGQQNHVAHLAYVMHALRLLQLGLYPKKVMELVGEAKKIERVHGYSFVKHIPEDNDVIELPMPPYKLSYQQIFMRITVEILMGLEKGELSKFIETQDELFGLIDSPELTESQNAGPNRAWPLDSIEIPVAKHESTTLLRLARVGDPETSIFVSWLSLSQARILSYMFAAIVALKKPGKQNNAVKFFKEALTAIDSELSGVLVRVETDSSNSNLIPPPSMSFGSAKKRHSQFLLLKCYTLFFLCLDRFIVNEWNNDEYLSELLSTAKDLPRGPMSDYFLPLTYYLSGVFFQASGNLFNAIQFFIRIRQHPAIATHSEMYILATVNLVLVLEGNYGRVYNDFATIANIESGLDTQHRDTKRGGYFANFKRPTMAASNDYGTPSAYYRKQLGEPICLEHANPMIRWAIQLLDVLYNKHGVDFDDVCEEKEAGGASVERKELKVLSKLLRYSISLNTPQISAIMPCIVSDRISDLNQRGTLLGRGLQEARTSNSALWAWCNGVLMDMWLRQTGQVDEASRQQQENAGFKKAVELLLNRVD